MLVPAMRNLTCKGTRAPYFVDLMEFKVPGMSVHLSSIVNRHNACGVSRSLVARIDAITFSAKLFKPQRHEGLLPLRSWKE
jgi:hypothetical protein